MPVSEFFGESSLSKEAQDSALRVFLMKLKMVSGRFFSLAERHINNWTLEKELRSLAAEHLAVEMELHEGYCEMFESLRQQLRRDLKNSIPDRVTEGIEAVVLDVAELRRLAETPEGNLQSYSNNTSELSSRINRKLSELEP